VIRQFNETPKEIGEKDMSKPIIAVTMGDPNGIGPELILKVITGKELSGLCRTFVVGEPDVFEMTADALDMNTSFRRISDVSEALFSPGTIDILCPDGMKIPCIQWGTLEPAMGKASAICIETALGMAANRQINGMVSGPMNKEAFHKAGFDYMDEMAYMTDITQSSDTTVMGVVDTLWTIPVTEHIAFRDIADGIQKNQVLRRIRLLNAALKKTGKASPKIAVAALNVHGGEGGLFGNEEIEEIGPAVETARSENIAVQGPFPADTVFVTAMNQKFDGVVCMYHDQANIGRKLLATRTGVTLFVGLPVPCATTAHGTAFDIAGKGLANPDSLLNAFKYTAMLSG